MPTIAPERQIYADLLVGRPAGVTWESLREYLASATVELGDISGIGTGQSGVDGVVRRASFVLRNDRAGMPGDSFSPRDRNSAWNKFDVDGDGTPEYAPLLWPNREVVLRVRIDGPVGQGTTAVVDDLGMADGATGTFVLSKRPVAESSETVTQKLPYRWTDYADKTWAELTDRTWVDIKEEQQQTRGVDYTIDYEAGTIAFATTPEAGVFIEAEYGYWMTLFHGLLGDAIRTSGPTVECDARDLAKRLQDTYILTPREYGSEAGTPAEDVIQQIIDDNLGAGEVTLYFPSGTASDPRPIAESPGFMVTPYVVEYMSVWDAIQQVAAQFGWFLGYRWHPNTGRMQLILMEPPRTKDATTADFYLSWEDDIYTQDLEITDRDIRNVVTVTYRNAATGDRESVTVQDDTSIATYGVRAMQIEEGDASLIDTPEEAERLANAALADLKDMTATTQLNLPLLPTLDVFSGIVVTDPRVSSTDDFYGVESVRHVLDFEARQFRTEAVAAGRVIGGHHRWLQMQTRPGKKDMPYTTADRIVTGTFELTPDKQIATPDDQVRVGPDGIEMQIPEQGGTRWSPSGLVFTRADGTESGYVRAAVAGIAEDGDYVPLNFSNEPVVVLSPARAIVYDPSVNTLQKLRLEAVDVSPEGFRVVAKLVRHDGPGQRTVFPNTTKWSWYAAAGGMRYCTDGGHDYEFSARAWSEHRLRDVGDKKVFTTGPNATGVVVRVREMLHAHAYAGNITVENRITYRLRIRQVGAPTWLATLGPFTRSIKTTSSLLNPRLEWRHVQVAHMFSNLAPAQYEVEIEITGKGLPDRRWGDNTADACFLLVEVIEEMSEAEIQLPEPIIVHYVAFESDSPGGEVDD